VQECVSEDGFGDEGKVLVVEEHVIVVKEQEGKSGMMI
jgi:hypothetical protein